MRSVRDMGERIAGYLIAQRWPGSERYGMVGARDVVSGRASPEVSPVYEQALVAYSLLRFGAVGERPIHVEARVEGLRILEDLAVVQPGESEPWGLSDGGIGAAACVIALSHEKSGFFSDELRAMKDRCQQTLEGLYSPNDGFADSIPAGARGLVAWAMVLGHDPDAEKAVRSVFRDTDAGRLVSQIGRAHV